MELYCGVPRALDAHGTLAWTGLLENINTVGCKKPTRLLGKETELIDHGGLTNEPGII